MEHYSDSIQGWFYYRDLYARLVEAAPKDRPVQFVEVGCWKGKSTAFMGVEIANSGKPITFTAVDHFKGSSEDEHKIDPEIAELYDVFLRNTQPISDALGDRFVVLREASTLAAEQFADGSVHFIMLDAGHTAEDVEADVNAWFPKLAVGGVMAGDDWRWPTVRAGVRAALASRIGRTCSAIGVENQHSYPWWLVVKVA